MKKNIALLSMILCAQYMNAQDLFKDFDVEIVSQRVHFYNDTTGYLEVGRMITPSLNFSFQENNGVLVFHVKMQKIEGAYEASWNDSVIWVCAGDVNGLQLYNDDSTNSSFAEELQPLHFQARSCVECALGEQGQLLMLSSDQYLWIIPRGFRSIYGQLYDVEPLGAVDN